MATDSDVLTELRRVTDREITLSDFEDWFVAMTWELDSPLLRTVTGLLAESAGNADEDVVLDGFARLLDQPTITIALTFPSSPVTSSSTSRLRANGSGQPAVVIERRVRWQPNVIQQAAEFRVPEGTHS